MVVEVIVINTVMERVDIMALWGVFVVLIRRLHFRFCMRAAIGAVTIVVPLRIVHK